jgi:hypothetical protein
MRAAPLAVSSAFGSEDGTWVLPPHRPPNPAVIAPVPGGDLRLYADRWWEVKEEQPRALRERQERKAPERQAKAGESRHGPCRWERESRPTFIPVATNAQVRSAAPAQVGRTRRGVLELTPSLLRVC